MLAVFTCLLAAINAPRLYISRRYLLDLRSMSDGDPKSDDRLLQATSVNVHFAVRIAEETNKAVAAISKVIGDLYILKKWHLYIAPRGHSRTLRETSFF